MTIYMPESPLAKSITFNTSSVVGMTQSIYTGRQQVFTHAGSWWTAEVTLPTLSHAQAGAWVAWLASLRGRSGSFYLSPMTVNRGYKYAGASVNGDSQSGTSLITDGWAVSAKVLSAGDYVTVDDCLYLVTADVYSDDGGNATIPIFPNLRAPGDDDEIETLNPYGIFRLTSNEIGWNIDEACTYGLSFSAQEVL